MNFDDKTEVSSNGSIIKTEKSIDIPLLSMVNFPNLSVKKVDIEFNMKINQYISKKNPHSKFGSRL
jgi:hypothetical protein